MDGQCRVCSVTANCPAQELHMSVYEFSFEPFRQHICWVILRADFLHSKLLPVHALLYPEVLDLNMPRLAEASSAHNAYRCRRVGVD